MKTLKISTTMIAFLLFICTVLSCRKTSDQAEAQLEQFKTQKNNKLSATNFTADPNASFYTGGDMYDTNGNIVHAVEGGIIKVGNLYYLWGMDRSDNNYTFKGVNIYSSADLKNWTFVNTILKNSTHGDLAAGSVVERPVIAQYHNRAVCIMGTLRGLGGLWNSRSRLCNQQHHRSLQLAGPLSPIRPG